MRKPLRLIALGALLSLGAGAAFGLGFGRTSLTSSLGQPLSFAVTLRLNEGEGVAPECLKAEVLSGDNRLAAGAVHVTLRGQTGEVNERALIVSTTTLIDEPIVTVNVSIGCPPSLTRSFVAFVDPPVLNLAGSGAVPASQSRSQDASPPPRAEASPEAAPPLRRRPVRPVRPAASAPIRSEAASQPDAPAAPARPRPRATAPAPTTPASAPSAAARSSAPAATRSGRAAEAAGARLQLEAARAVGRGRNASGPATNAVAASSASAAAVAAVPAPGNAGAAATASSAALAGASTTPAVPSTPIASTPADAASGAAVSSASATAASPASVDSAERTRLKALEDDLARLRTESESSQRSLAALQARLAQADQGHSTSPMLYVLMVLCALLLVALVLLWRQRARERKVLEWWATPEGEAIRAAATRAMVTEAGGLTGPDRGPLSMPDRAPDRGPDTRPETPRALAAAPSAISEMTMPTVSGPGSLSPVEMPRREMSVEELIDLEQQVEFFVVLGQDEAAIDLLLSHLRGNGAGNPLPYIKLLDIYRGRGEREAYERIRERFNHRFNAIAPAAAAEADEGRSLEGYPVLLARLQQVWRDSAQAVEVLDQALFTRSEADSRFELPAYRDLLFLYALARDLSEHQVPNEVDLLLPLDDTGPDTESPMLSTIAVQPNPSVQRPLKVDFDVSEPGAFDALPQDSRYDSEFGSGFGGLPEDRPVKPPRDKPKG